MYCCSLITRLHTLILLFTPCWLYIKSPNTYTGSDRSTKSRDYDERSCPLRRSYHNSANPDLSSTVWSISFGCSDSCFRFSSICRSLESYLFRHHPASYEMAILSSKSDRACLWWHIQIEGSKFGQKEMLCELEGDDRVRSHQEVGSRRWNGYPGSLDIEPLAPSPAPSHWNNLTDGRGHGRSSWFLSVTVWIEWRE